jgi:murein L,D-transpeptidase YafK
MHGTPRELKVLIEKAARRLSVFAGQHVERRYPVVLGKNSAADKEVEGDHATPLGAFYICAKNPRSRFFLSLCISYPNAEDAQRGLAAGLLSAEEYAQILEAMRLQRMPPQHTRLGGEIYIHGSAVGQQSAGTRGCIALDNAAMQELYELIALGTPVVIVA